LLIGGATHELILGLPLLLGLFIGGVRG